MGGLATEASGRTCARPVGFKRNEEQQDEPHVVGKIQMLAYLRNSSGSSSRTCFISTPMKDRFPANAFMSNWALPSMSRFPSSIIHPNLATHFQDRCSSSPAKELSTMSTPRPLVLSMTPWKNDGLRESKMRSRGIP